MTEATGPVRAAEVAQCVLALKGLYARAVEHEQTFLAMALGMGAESLEENAENACEWDAHDAG